MLSINRDNLYDLYVTQKLSTVDIAEVLGCHRSSVWVMLVKFGIPRRTLSEAIRTKPPEKRHGWKGGRINVDGYVYIYCPDHPYAKGGMYVAEHRLVMEKKLGRYLERWEQVHHRDGIKDHNTEDNIELSSASNHTMMTMYCQKCELRKRVRVLEWQVRHLNQMIYGTDKPSAMDILQRGLEDE